jgi:hypothetical protein
VLNIGEVSLTGDHILLHPPLSADLDSLCNAAKDREIWKNPYAFFLTYECRVDEGFESIDMETSLRDSQEFIPMIDKINDKVVSREETRRGPEHEEIIETLERQLMNSLKYHSCGLFYITSIN